MKKIQKQLSILLVVLITIFIQKQFVDKPQQQHDDNERQTVELVRVVDGDTVILNINGEKERVRLVGMDSPESVKPNSPVECFGKEASVHAKEILKNKDLEFVKDSSQDSRDRFGRLLGYLFMYENERRVNFAEQMIADGYAYEYTYRKKHPYRYQADFKKAERMARKEKHGLWADGACKK